MPHPGHFLLSHYCRFFLNTYVGKYIVSTVGELMIPKVIDGEIIWEPRTIGAMSNYETMVFPAMESGLGCCPYETVITEELEVKHYPDRDAARKGHEQLCEKWSRKR